MDDDTKNPRDIWHEAQSPLDFSKICRFPNECYDYGKVHDILPEFHGNDGVSATHHIASLCKLMSDFNVHHGDDIMIVFAITLEGDAIIWFYGLLDESIDSLAKFFERFLLRWHDGTVDEIEELAIEYDALIPRLHPELKEQTIEDPIKEALQRPLVEDITEDIPNMAIIENIADVKLPQVFEQLHDEELELPQVYVTKNVHEQFYDEDSDVPQVHFINGDRNSYLTDQPKQLYDGGLYLIPISQWIEVSCAHSKFFYRNFVEFLYPNNLML